MENPISRNRSDYPGSSKKYSSLEGGFPHAIRRAFRKLSPGRRALPKDDAVDDSVALDTKGPIGLNLLHDPEDPHVDFIFVHGLNGGSRKTWSATSDPQHYWPKEWLSQDPDFAAVRIHCFGYNADWGEWSESGLNILDFARFLLGSISNNPAIRKSSTNLVLIGHSMGGIVIKKAYMLAREDPNLQDLTNRIHTLYFLATPHRGSSFAKLFANILTVSYGQKPFVAELSRSSQSIALINDSFRRCTGDLQLWSFYETKPTWIVVKHAIIVDKDSAIIGLEKENCQPLGADHREICRFPQETDPNYQTLRNTFTTTIDQILTKNSRTSKAQHDQLLQLTGVSSPPDDELLALEDVRVQGSCEWLAKTESYESWQKALPATKPFLWLSGNAGFGKSVLSAYIIHELQREPEGCSYFFFKHGNPDKSSVTGCLWSLAYQMARTQRLVLRRLLEFHESSSSWETWNEKTLWQKIFLGCIFKNIGSKIHFWVIDALDECQKCYSFLNLLANAPTGLKILFTSRNSPEVEKHMGILDQRVARYQLKQEDTRNDFSKFIESRMEHVPVSHGEDAQKLKQSILEKASGSFLWVSLVLKRLEKAYSEEEAQDVLNEVPIGMNELYDRMLGNMILSPRALTLAKSVYMWTLLSLRPLDIDTLQSALKLDARQTVHNLEKFLPDISGQFVTINHQREAEVIHQTAREYLLTQDHYTDLSIHKQQCHARIAQICLTIIAGNSMKWQKSQTRKRPRCPTTPSPDFTDYACEYYSDHLQRSSSEDDQNWDLLCKFLERNLLLWIEYLAEKGRLRSVTRTAKNLQAYFRRRVKYLSPISSQKAKMETWIYDLFRLSAKFGSSLTLSPSSIHSLIPAMCPSESIFSRYSASRPSHTGVTIKGLEDRSWDDCLVRIDYPGHHTSAIACGDQHSAVALSDGVIHVYFQESMQTKYTLNHGGRANILAFSSEDQFLATSGQRHVRVWDLVEGIQLWAFDTSHQVLTLLFVEEENTLAAATQGNYAINWDLREGQEIERWQWTDSIRTTPAEQRPLPQPSKALFSPDYTTLAVSYRGYPLYGFHVGRHKFFACFARETGSCVNGTPNHYVVDAMAFNPNPEFNNLVVSYGDGEVVVFDIESTELQHRCPDLFAHSLKCSPNGRTLVTGSSRGTIQIFEFAGARGERLLPLYTINAHDDGIQGIAFSSNSLRFADIRGSQYRIWEPAVLACTDIDEGSQSELSHAVSIEVRSVGMLEGPPDPEITAMCCTSNGQFVFCGKKDGSVTYFETRTAAQKCVLYRHAAGIGITCIVYVEKSSLLVTADESGRVLINCISATQNGCEYLKTAVEIRSQDALSHLIVHDSGTRLLLGGKKSVKVWTTEGKQVGSTILFTKEEDVRKLASHPLHSEYFISIGPKDVRIFSWKDALEVDTCAAEGQRVEPLEFRVTPPTPTHKQQFKDEETPNSFIEEYAGPYLACLFKQNPASPSLKGTILRIWPASSVVASKFFPPSIPIPSVTNHLHKLKQIIAMEGSLLLFLDTDLWICSLDISTPSSISKGVRRHFFLLSEWQNIDGDFIVEYVPATCEFLIARKHQLLVVGRGLEVEEPWIPTSASC